MTRPEVVMPGEYVQDELYFFCRDCYHAGYQPFLLSNTSGIEFYIKQTRDNIAPGNSVLVCLHFSMEAPQLHRYQLTVDSYASHTACMTLVQ